MGTGSLTFDGTAANYASVPDSAALSVSGDIDIRMRADLDLWTWMGRTQAFVWKDPAYRFDTGWWSNSGELQFQWYDGGNLATKSVDSSGIGASVTAWVRVTLDVDGGAGGVGRATFYKSTTDTNDDTACSWTQIGSPDDTGAAPTAIDDDAAAVLIGGTTGDAGIVGDLLRCVIYSDLAETTKVLDADFTTMTAAEIAADAFAEDSTNAATVSLVGAAWTAVADATCAVSGTAVAGGVLESEIVTGGETIILTLTGDTWEATVGDDNAITTALIAGIDSAQSEATGWDAEVKANMVFGDVTRTSPTVVTVVLAAEAAYAITANETITVTVPITARAGAGGTGELVASPTFVVTNETPAVTGGHYNLAGPGQLLQTGG